jgi:starch synthase
MTALVPAYLKTTYKNDPTFKNAKAIYSVYENDPAVKLKSEFARKAIMNDMTEAHVEEYKNGDCDALHKGAISFSDAVVYATENVSDEVLKFVKKGNKPTLEYISTSDFENYYNLYEEIANEELVSLA